MQVTVDDFEIDINIPNTDETPIANRLQGFIDIYEPEYMTKLLGETLYTDFKAGLLIDPLPAKWQSLQDKISTYQIAVYIYWHWVRKNTAGLSGFNTAISPKAENAIVVSPIDDMVFNWNRMVELSRKTVKFIQENNADYGNYYLPNTLNEYYYGWNCDVPDILKHQNSLGL